MEPGEHQSLQETRNDSQRCGAHRCPSSGCQEEEEPRLVRRSPTRGTKPSGVPAIVEDALASSGRPLGSEARSVFEPLLGVDLSSVRVHTDALAAASARAIDAHAYTVGTDVVFATGRYQPGTPAGDRLLAHELGHRRPATVCSPGERLGSAH